VRPERCSAFKAFALNSRPKPRLYCQRMIRITTITAAAFEVARASVRGPAARPTRPWRELQRRDLEAGEGLTGQRANH
jgi:hypothetical protein